VVAERPKWPRQIDRLRLIHTEKRKTVYILRNIPLDIPVDELLLPDLWVTEKAAERWIVKNPQRHKTLLLGLGGVLRLIARRARPGGQRRLCGNGPIQGRRSRRCWGFPSRMFG